MELFIKHMVCIRCVMAVEEVLTKLNIVPKKILLGRVVINKTLSTHELASLDTELRHFHLELMQGRKQIIAERIKTLIIELIHDNQTDSRLKLSAYLSSSMYYDYTYLSNVFSEMENNTIEKYFILQRLERVKELIVYEEMSITEIADQLNFSSVSHLCVQFRKVTGLTPAGFRKQLLEPGFQWREI